MEETGLEPVPPRGFVYHETRCGSTLVANMLAGLEPNRVFSESKPPVQVCLPPLLPPLPRPAIPI